MGIEGGRFWKIIKKTMAENKRESAERLNNGHITPNRPAHNITCLLLQAGQRGQKADGKDGKLKYQVMTESGMLVQIIEAITPAEAVKKWQENFIPLTMESNNDHPLPKYRVLADGWHIVVS